LWDDFTKLYNNTVKSVDPCTINRARVCSMRNFQYYVRLDKQKCPVCQRPHPETQTTLEFPAENSDAVMSSKEPVKFPCFNIACCREFERTYTVLGPVNAGQHFRAS